MSRTIILDTDIDMDCDDVGALAALHALSQREEADLLGVVCSVPYPPTAGCVRAINRFYGRPDIPVGLLMGERLDESPRFEVYRAELAKENTEQWSRYNGAIAQECRHPEDRTWSPGDAVELYRTLLANRTDRSVTIVAIGLLTALQKLLHSGPDEASPLTGTELVRAKVRELVTMGLGTFPEGHDAYNWGMDREAAADVLGSWPTRLVVNELGETILTGSGLARSHPEHSPVRRAYEIYLGGPGRDRCSWDQVTVLYAVRGRRHCFRERSGYRIRYDAASGTHRWTRDHSGAVDHVHLEQTASDREIAAEIEDLMAYVR